MGWIFSAFLTFYIIILITRKCVSVCVCVCGETGFFGARRVEVSAVHSVEVSAQWCVGGRPVTRLQLCPHQLLPSNTIVETNR